MSAKKKTGKRIKKVVSAPVRYPMMLLRPVAKSLRGELKSLKKRRKNISEDDPFKDVNRISDNAAPDADAEEQFGHARSAAIKEQIDVKIIQIRRALGKIKVGSYGICEECGKMINTDRLMVKPEATLCIKCEQKAEKNS